MTSRPITVPARLRLVALLPALVAAGCESPTGSGVPAELTLHSPSGFVEVGQTLRVSATVKDASGRVLEGARIQWTSRSPEVAEVAGGLVKGLAPGEVAVVASAGGAADSLRITVEPPPVGQVVVWPDTLHLIQGRAGKLFVEVHDRSGRPMPHRLLFSSSDSAVARVEAGEVHALTLGAATVTVTAGVESVQVPVSVVTGERYSITVLGTLGGRQSGASDINNRGEVVGWSHAPSYGSIHPFLWRRGQMLDLGLPSGFIVSSAAAVNDSGTVVGTATGRIPNSMTIPRQGWIWRSGSTTLLTDAAQPPSYPYTAATDINSRGQVSGYVHNGYYKGTGGQGFLWKGGEVAWLGVPPQEEEVPISPAWSTPFAVSDRGAVAVTAYYPGRYESIAYSWQDGRFTRIRLPSSARVIRARDVDEAGQVLGSYHHTSTQEAVGFLWDGSGVRTLPSPMGAPDGINRYGDIVGSRFLLRRGQVRDLNEMIPSGDWFVVEAVQINDLGQIVGVANNRTTGEWRGMILTPAR